VRADAATRRYRAPLERETLAPRAYRASPANTPPPSGPASRGVHVTYAPRFKGSLLRLDARKYRAFVAGLPGLGISGGAVYDALIATTALDHDATLLTCDRRARLV